jgi:hypothetical protein
MVPVDDNGNRRKCIMMDKKNEREKKESEMKLNESQYNRI